MDGKEIVQTVIDIVESNQLPNNLRQDTRVIYKYADLAAQKWCDITGYLVKTGSIKTVDGTQVYDLPSDFNRVYTKDENYDGVLKYYDGSDYYFPVEVAFSDIFVDNNTDEQDYPMQYAIYRTETRKAPITGTVDSTGTLTAGQSLLNDTTGLFTTTNLIHERDVVHNTTDGSDGIVLSVTDASNVQSALFGGANNFWTTGDAYNISRHPLYQLYFDSPLSTTDHTITIPYIATPTPVFTDYGYWNLPEDASYAICCEAIFMYMTRMALEISPNRFHKVFQESIWSYSRYLPKGKMVSL
jgi:hypothetical protein